MQEHSATSQQRTALVTGATGFIGAHLVQKLKTAGWNVHLLRRVAADDAEALQSSDLSSSSVTHLHPYRGTTDDVIAAVSNSAPDVVFHLASLFLASHTPAQIEPLIASNVLFGTQLLEAMSLAKVTTLVNAGTSWQYYHSQTYHPVNLYAATKQAFEDIIAYYVSARGLRAITLNLFDSYGPGDTRRKLLRLLLESHRTGQHLGMSGGEQPLDLVHVDDVCDAFIHAQQLLRSPDFPAYSSYGVTGGQRRSLKEVVATIEHVLGTKLNITFGAQPYREREVMHLWDGPQLPGWNAKISLERGFTHLFEQDLRSSER